MMPSSDIVFRTLPGCRSPRLAKLPLIATLGLRTDTRTPRTMLWLSKMSVAIFSATVSISLDGFPSTIFLMPLHSRLTVSSFVRAILRHVSDRLQLSFASSKKAEVQGQKVHGILCLCMLWMSSSTCECSYDARVSRYKGLLKDRCIIGGGLKVIRQTCRLKVAVQGCIYFKTLSQYILLSDAAPSFRTRSHQESCKSP